jgi:hypothetical protein
MLLVPNLSSSARMVGDEDGPPDGLHKTAVLLPLSFSRFILVILLPQLDFSLHLVDLGIIRSPATFLPFGVFSSGITLIITYFVSKLLSSLRHLLLKSKSTTSASSC